MKRIIILVLAGLMAAPLLWAEKKAVPEQASERAKARVETIIEKQFKDGATDVIWDETEGTAEEARKMGMMGYEKRAAKEKVKIYYPKVVATNKGVKFYDKNGKIKKEYQNKYLRGSGENKKVFALGHRMGKLPPEDSEKGIPLPEVVTMVDEDGNELWKTAPSEFGAGQLMPLSNDRFITDEAAEMGSNSFAIYDKKGLIKRIEWPFALRFSVDGKGEYIVTYWNASHYTEPHVGLWDSAGNELWKKEIPYKDFSVDEAGMIVCGKTSYIFSYLSRLSFVESKPVSENLIVLLEDDGSIFVKIPIPQPAWGTRFLVPSKDGKNILLILRRTEEILIYNYETKTGKLLSRKSIVGDEKYGGKNFKKYIKDKNELLLEQFDEKVGRAYVQRIKLEE